jgi:hypothetical protein
MIDLIENTDYEMIPQDNDDEFWAIRILKGDFVETVYKYNVITFKDDKLHFDFDVITTPNDEATTDNIELQQTVADVLFSVMVTQENYKKR